MATDGLTRRGVLLAGLATGVTLALDPRIAQAAGKPLAVVRSKSPRGPIRLELMRWEGGVAALKVVEAGRTYGVRATFDAKAMKKAAEGAAEGTTLRVLGRGQTFEGELRKTEGKWRCDWDDNSAVSDFGATAALVFLFGTMMLVVVATFGGGMSLTVTTPAGSVEAKLDTEGHAGQSGKGGDKDEDEGDGEDVGQDDDGAQDADGPPEP